MISDILEPIGPVDARQYNRLLTRRAGGSLRFYGRVGLGHRANEARLTGSM